jgi:hypothetical protein
VPSKNLSAGTQGVGLPFSKRIFLFYPESRTPNGTASMGKKNENIKFKKAAMGLSGMED